MIRKATTDDIPAIRQMAEVVFRQTYKDILSPEQVEYMMNWMYSEASLTRQMCSLGHIFYIADGRGYVSFRFEGHLEDGSDLFHIEKLYVMPEYQGTGLGRSLFNKVLECIRQLSDNPVRLELNVNRYNKAVSFYEHLGMSKTRAGDFSIGSNFFMNDYIMSMDVVLATEKASDAPMPSDKIQRTLAWLDDHGISYEVHYHPAIFTIEDCLAYWKNIEATHCKNLFMRNHKGNRHYLISYECHKNLDIHALEHKLHQGKLSFASPERMERCLGVTPGSVCAFGLINDIDIAGSADPKELFENGHRVKYFLDSELQTAEKVSFHPCDNTASVVLSHDMFIRFLSLWGGETEWIEI